MSWVMRRFFIRKSTHKTVIKIKTKNGGLLQAIPASLEYVFFEVSAELGYAQVVENSEKFKLEKVNVS